MYIGLYKPCPILALSRDIFPYISDKIGDIDTVCNPISPITDHSMVLPTNGCHLPLMFIELRIILIFDTSLNLFLILDSNENVKILIKHVQWTKIYLPGSGVFFIY